MRTTHPALPCLLILGLAAGLHAQEDAPAAPGPPPPKPYANTPEELVPYGASGPPFQRFFKRPQPYRGPRGPEEAAPGGTPRVGLLLPASGGPEAARSAMVRRGVELAFAEHLGDAPVAELVLREADPLWGSAANGMVELALRHRVVAVIGAVEGGATHVALRVALKTGVFLVNTATTDPTLTETAIPWLLRCRPDDRQQAYRLARHMVRERGLRRIAVLRANDRHARLGIRELVDSVRRLGAPVRVEMRFEPGQRDLDAQVARIRAAGPDAVVLWGEAADLGHAARRLREGGVEVPLFGPGRLVDPVYLQEAGAAAAGTTATYPFRPDADRPRWAAFRRRFQARFGTEPDQDAAYAYDGACILLAALGKAGNGRVALRDTLASLQSWDGVTGHMTFDPTHNNITPPVLARVIDGTYRFE